MTAPQSLPPSADKTAASPGEGATTRHRCPSCSHVTIPARRCECKHLEEMRNLAGDDVTRKACSVSEGPKATPCGCRLFTPELSDFPQENH